MSTFDLQAYTGTHVQLLPYAPGVGYQRDLVYWLWAQMDSERAWPRILHHLPKRKQGLLETFIDFFADKNIVLICDLQETFLGIIWIDPGIAGVRTNINIWFKRSAWGAPAREAGILGTCYGHECLRYPMLWGFTPWRSAMRYALDCGYKYHSVLPRYGLVNGVVRDVYAVYHEEGG